MTKHKSIAYDLWFDIKIYGIMTYGLKTISQEG